MSSVPRGTLRNLREEWTIKATACLQGKTILRAYYPDKNDLKKRGVLEDEPAYNALWLELNDGTVWFPQADDEGNGPGTFACYAHSIKKTPRTTVITINKIGGVLPVMF